MYWRKNYSYNPKHAPIKDYDKSDKFFFIMLTYFTWYVGAPLFIGWLVYMFIAFSCSCVTVWG